MAVKTWIGGAAAGSQFDTVTVGGTIAENDVFNILVAGEVIATYTAASGNGADEVAQGLVTAWNASGNPLGTSITAADTSAATAGTLTLTADNPGVPFTVTVSKTSASGTIAVATTAENYGPNAWSTLANWEGQALPVASDEVVIQGSFAILYDLDQSSINLAGFTVRGYSGNIGSPGDPLKIKLATTSDVEIDSTGTTYLDLASAGGSADITCVINNTGGGTTAGLFLSSDKIDTMTINRGSVAVGMDPGDTSTVVNDLRVRYITNQAGDAQVEVGSGVALSTVEKTGGSCTLHGAVHGSGYVTNQAGNLRTEGTGTIPVATISGGTWVANSTGTITLLTLEGGVVDFTRSRGDRTVTTLNLSGSGQVMLNTDVVTLTNKIGVSGMVQVSSSEL